MDFLNQRTARALSEAQSGAPTPGPTELATSCGSFMGTISLTDLPRNVDATVAAMVPANHADEKDMVVRLVEIGFVPGEHVRVIAHGYPGREPIAVRLGGTTFALRRYEAEHVRVTVDGDMGL